MSLLAKLGSKVAARDNALRSRLLHAKYLRHNSFFNCNAKAGDTMVWKRILGTWDLIFKGSCFKLGNGWNTNPWKDPWIPWLEGKIPSLKSGALIGDVDRVAHLLKQPISSKPSWNVEKLRALSDEDTVVEICELELCQGPGEDKLLWTASNSGIFSSKSDADLLNDSLLDIGHNGVWK